MEFTKFIEREMLNEMALRKELLNLEQVQETLKKLESAGVDIHKFTLDEITMAFFFHLDDSIRGETAQHQQEVMKYWKPAKKGTEADANYRQMRDKYIKLMNLGIESAKTVMGSNPSGDNRPVRISISWQDIKKAAKGQKFDVEEKRGNVKKAKVEEE